MGSNQETAWNRGRLNTLISLTRVLNTRFDRIHTASCAMRLRRHVLGRPCHRVEKPLGRFTPIPEISYVDVLSCPPELVSNHAPQSVFQRLLFFANKAAQCCIDECLVVPTARVVNLLPKAIQSVPL